MQKLEKILEEINENTISLFSGVNMISAKKVEKILRKHMGDGWISVEDRLPISGEGAVEVTVRSGYRTIGYYDQYREEWWTLDEESILDVIAWKEPSKPYRPERSDNNDRE